MVVCEEAGCEGVVGAGHGKEGWKKWLCWCVKKRGFGLSEWVRNEVISVHGVF